MALRFYTTVIDSHDVAAQGHWWAETLDWQIIYEADDELVLIPRHWPADLDPMSPVPHERWTGLPQGLVFVKVPEDKQVKNRLHIDLAPHVDDDRDAEIASLLARGATPADVGQGDVFWTVLRDPEGNEFCVLSSRDR
ncbi:VOC family protein [Sanguibacter sp. HDW7]|uniref:VOC family protein n=1 Tax=Sanguibacter sp. HDW7 TaxID=2714931 RepID=UPI00140ACAB8|nr:VOC family protein [Sanguibacter sp. HDW7]QIK82308.1 VOC family protein [Sanguibacter sp. HDW7]